MTDYADITLLECNRRQSTNAETLTDNSIWTNRLGEVVELEMGDEISVESAFINQKGCANPLSIEFRGVDLKAEGTFNYSQDILPEIKFINDEGNKVQQTTTIFQNKLNIDTKIPLKDNEANIEVSYYKTMNGENHIFLPRNFLPRIGAAKTASEDFTNLLTTATAEESIWSKSDFNLDQNAATDANTKGMDRGYGSGIPVYAPDHIELCAGDYTDGWTGHLRKSFNWNDYGIYQTGKFGATGEISKRARIDGFKIISTHNKNYYVIRPKINNDRFTMFQKDYMWENYNDIQKVVYTEDPAPRGDGVSPVLVSSKMYYDGTGLEKIKGQINKYEVQISSSPDLFQYHEKKDLITLKLAKGFQSPSSISEQLTQQIQEETEDSPECFNVLNEVAGTDRMSYTIKTKTFKTYNAANYGDFTHGNKQEYNVNKNASAFNYYSTFNTIFVKRADLFTAGRKINNWYGYVGNDENVDPFVLTDSGTEGFGTPNFIKNEILIERNNTGAGGTPIGNYSQPIDTSWEWNDFNLTRLNELFKVQGNYPELFKCMTSDRINENELFKNTKETTYLNGTIIQAVSNPTIENARFLHMSRFNRNTTAPPAGTNNYPYLGDSGHYIMGYKATIDPAVGEATFDCPHTTLPIFFKYYPELADKYIETPDIKQDLLCYGFASKIRYGDKYYIRIHPEAPYSQGIHMDFFAMRAGYKANDPATANDWRPYKIEAGKCLIGWDFHFNSYGNVCSLGFQGDLGTSFSREYEKGYGSDFNLMNPSAPTTGEMARKVRSAVIGANNAAFVFDNISGKFGIKDLHMPEKIGQPFNAGQTDSVAARGKEIETATTIPIIADANSVCYKINKRLRVSSYCPDLEGNETIIEGNTQLVKPPEPATTNPPKAATAPENIMSFTFMNTRISPYKIFDSHMGVNLNLGNCFKIDDINRQPEIWERGMLGLLGFTYDQFNPKIINENNRGDARVDFRNIESLHKPTTNCEVLNTDIQNYSMNPYGGINYSPTITNPIYIPKFNVVNKSTGAVVEVAKTYFPPIVQDTNSITIEGLKLPSLVARPYLTIRSDILSHSKYIGGNDSGLKLPIISVINKINADKDFIQVSDSSFNYTITRPCRFSEITTAITNPDGSLADTEDGNAVIYKIMKKGDLTNYDILSQILNESKKGKKK